jgi:hypothetical protein
MLQGSAGLPGVEASGYVRIRCIPLRGCSTRSLGHRGERDRPLIREAVKAIVVHRLSENIKSAERESGAIDKAIRVVGPGGRDIKKYGIRGGRNSVFRKPFG